MKTQIGTLKVEAQDRRISYEVACWYRTLKVEAQEVPVYAEVQANGEVKDFPGLSWHEQGTVTEAYFPSLWGGVPIHGGRTSWPEELGRKDVYHGFSYAHSAAAAILEGKVPNLTLLPEFEARRIDFEYEGEPHHTYGIFRKAAA